MMEFIRSPYIKAIVIFFATLFLLALIFSDYLVQFFLDYLILYRYLTLFVIVFLAGLCVPIPMNVLLLAIGAFSITGNFSFSISLLLASVANLLGDLVAFFLFRRYGHMVLRDKFVEQYSFFLRLEAFFIKYTNISIYVSRLIGLLGTPVNFLSGYLKVSPIRFAIFDYLGNFTFAFFFLWLGSVVGDRWVDVSEFINIIINIIAATLVVSISVFIYKNKQQSKVEGTLPS